MTKKDIVVLAYRSLLFCVHVFVFMCVQMHIYVWLHICPRMHVWVEVKGQPQEIYNLFFDIGSFTWAGACWLSQAGGWWIHGPACLHQQSAEVTSVYHVQHFLTWILGYRTHFFMLIKQAFSQLSCLPNLCKIFLIDRWYYIFHI